MLHRPYLVLIFLIILNFSAHAQWVRTSGPYGGAVKALAVNGSTAFAASSLAGVFKSTDNGSNWIYSALRETDVTDLLVKGNSVYAAVIAQGIYVSRDDGVTWNTSNAGLTDLNPMSFTVSGDKIYVATFHGVFSSSDDGNSWTLSGLGSMLCQSLSSNADHIFVGTAANGLYVSNDNGATWDPTVFTNNQIVFVNAFDNTIFLETSAKFYRSPDNGKNWSTVGSGLTQGAQCLAQVSGTLYAGTSGDGVMKSIDNGTTFTASGIPGNSVISLVANTGTILAASFAYSGIYRSDDNGVTWAISNKGLYAHDIRSMFVNADTLVVGSHLGGILGSTDGGNNWNSLATNVPNQAYVTFSAAALEHTGNNYVAGASDAVYFSPDKGLTWKISDLQKQALAFAGDNSKIYAGTVGHGVYVSTNHGVNWSATGMTDKQVNALSMKGDTICAGTDVGFFISYNHGNTWSAKNNSLPTNFGINAVAIHGKMIFAGISAYGLYSSSDHGANWIKASSGFAGQTPYSLAVVRNYVVAGTDNGIYFSSDNGLTWSAIDTGLPPMPVQTMASNDNFLFAGTPGGVYKHGVLQPQTINFTTIPSLNLADASYQMFAQASSGSTVTFTSSDLTKATIDGNSLRLVAAGRCSVTATQPGGFSFVSAPPITQTFCINPRKPTVQLAFTVPPNATLTSSAMTGNQWFLNGSLIKGAIGNVLNVQGAGIYTVQTTTTDGCSSEISDEISGTITGEITSNNDISLYPIPSNDYIFLKDSQIHKQYDTTDLVSGTSAVDMLGQVIDLKLDMVGDKMVVDIRHLVNGIYVLNITKGNSIRRFKFIKE